ncbi:MAG: kinase [Rubellimicrobium sp.]|nr:kinase [Rubellimicrobium sp.]
MRAAPPDILCIGSALWDVIGQSPSALGPGADGPGRIHRQPGGVALNLALALRRFGLRPAVLTALGRDRDGDELLAEAERAGLVMDHVHRRADLTTDRYMAIEAEGRLIAAIADAHSLEAAGAAILGPLTDGRLGTPEAPWSGLVALDGNLTTKLLSTIARSPLFARADLRIAPASPGKADRLAPCLGHPGATLYLNLYEARTLCRTDVADAPPAAAAPLARGVRRVLVTDGPRAAAEATPDGVLTQMPPQVRAVRATGAGDTFTAAHIAAEWQGATRPEALVHALSAAAAFVSDAPHPSLQPMKAARS